MGFIAKISPVELLHITEFADVVDEKGRKRSADRVQVSVVNAAGLFVAHSVCLVSVLDS